MFDIENIGGCTYNLRFHPDFVFEEKYDLLSIPPVRGENVKTFRWDYRLQIQNLFMTFKQVPRW